MAFFSRKPAYELDETIELSLPPRKISESWSLAEHTTIRTGGKARVFQVAEDIATMISVTRGCDFDGTDLLILSGGSNTLISDEGFPGMVMLVAAQGARAVVTYGELVLEVNAGVVLDTLIAETVKRGWRGLEMLSGIPGLVGAAPIQNIGAYGAEIATAIRNVVVYDRQAREVTVLETDQCQFGYRTSIFKQNPDRYVILRVDLGVGLDRNSKPVTYAELAQALKINIGEEAPLKKVRHEVLKLRQSKGMVLDSKDHDTWSAGSFFTNPFIDDPTANALPEDAPRFDQGDGAYKTSAAWLIEHAGFPKGYGGGPATLSTKHVLALTNRGTATTSDIITLAREIQQGVRDRFGITLSPEPTLVGVTW
ncbi:MAG: UDP-N-acetylmuramate dehydrogenase [Propionibacteriaceae bacterium]|nr:UDP-N-acetylmuramate dehydrogenase [Propionibacteriaceae bacterium]